MSQSIITKDTLIPIGAVIIVLSAAFSYGIMYNKVDTLTLDFSLLSDEISDLREDNKQINEKLNLIMGALNLKSFSYGGQDD